ncbi:heterokaryon incompatibility protein 6 [Leptodontidium sp. MPI-SDFR-AT-0119]|nr:heterokaryon incompatibility protein 6 [Leptodontidium sp. MPI-SDFR-AT-0119]
MASRANPSESGGADFARVIASLLTAQNSCPVHEQCDSSCPKRIGVRRYRLMPDGERRDEVDMRAQLAAMNLNAGQSKQTQTLTISDNVPSFTYSPLARPDSMIRLLKIKRGIFRADPVDCELTHFDINSPPAYGALSYCWGAPPDDRKFLCNGKVFYGRASLERALKRLRAGFGPGEREEYIWADALCINQQDPAEKGSQICLMERIYSSAATVYVDLGDTEGSEVLLNDFTLRFGGAGGMGMQDTLTESGHPEHPLHYKTAFQALTQPWFTRTWIIQEVALARRAKYMFEGNIFTQEHLDSILSKDAMRANPSRLQELMGNKVALGGFLNYTKLQQIKNHNGKMDPLQLIQLTRDFAATNPEDKIFGLFALMTDADREAVGPYSRSVQQVFRRFAALQVRRGQTIMMLDSAGLQRRRLEGINLPSWVPDWTAQNTSPKVISTLCPVPYSASGSAQTHVQLVGDATGTGGLSVRGLLVDTIDTATHVHSAPRTSRNGEPDFLVFHDKFRAAFDELVSQGKSVYSNNEEAFARLLLMDDMYTGRNAILYSSPIVDPAATYQGALAAWREGRGFQAGMKMNSVQTYQMQASTTAVGRGFSTTRTGYIGLVPPLAQAGDLLVVIFGATVPYVVRRVQSGYLLVGDAFVHGLMYGEAFGRQDLRATDIVLV